MHHDPITLTAAAARLTLDRGGRLIALEADGRSWLSQPAHCCELVLQRPSTPNVLGPRRNVVLPNAPCRTDAQPDRVCLHYDRVTVDGVQVEVGVTVEIAAGDGEFTFRFSVTNRSPDWIVREVRGPFVPAPLSALHSPTLLWPLGAGERIADPSRIGTRCLPYPTRLFMPWMALDAGTAGLYVGCHDSTLETITLCADAGTLAGVVTLSFGQIPFCGSGTQWRSPPVVLRPYAGTWHVAAARYRRFADTWMKPLRRPDWLRAATGWQLVILKQQNGEVHWPYADIDRLVELGQQNGLNVLGLFGWTEGGHDRRYPIYQPDADMGGADALRQAIARAHAAGQHVVLYTNGQLLDMQTEWFAENGSRTAAVSERGEPFGETWAKYKDAAPRPMAYACQSCASWSDRLLDLAKSVQALGADGIIFDQLGACQPMFCFSPDHGHTRPSRATAPGVAANIARVQREMHAIAPNFIVMVEHVTDAINLTVDLTHGCGIGFEPSHTAFPELLRFTFPEILATQRHPTPVMDRNTANWACLYGYAHEVEYRYWPDRLYVDRGIVPAVTDYERVGAPPNIAMMRQLEPHGSADYLLRVTRFAQRHADLLRNGTFRDTLDFKLDNPAVQAKAYVAGPEFGVLAWNPTTAAQTVRVTVADAEFIAADAPGRTHVDPKSPVPPESIRMLRFRRHAPRTAT